MITWDWYGIVRECVGLFVDEKTRPMTHKIATNSEYLCIQLSAMPNLSTPECAKTPRQVLLYVLSKLVSSLANLVPNFNATITV